VARHKMNVIVVCEFSGVVRDAFRARGHNAWSCDVLPCDGDPTYHLQTDCMTLDYGRYDLVIAHPPCTYLAVSGARWNVNNPERQAKQREAVEFARRLMNLPVPKIALENPIGHLSTAIRKPDQIVQPWMFGHGETKATCLWLKNLPKLVPTQIVEGREARIHKMPPSDDRGKLRSITYQGIAEAMAEQWGND
jgi:hypothetical protein